MESDKSSQEIEKVETKEIDKKVKENSFFSNWKLLLVLGVSIFSFILLLFFWLFGQHFIAVKSMNAWSNDVNGVPVNCVFRDTDDNGYISCTAIVNEQLVPLECGTNIFNLGCRVSNYDRQKI